MDVADWFSSSLEEAEKIIEENSLERRKTVGNEKHIKKKHESTK